MNFKITKRNVDKDGKYNVPLCNDKITINDNKGLLKTLILNKDELDCRIYYKSDSLKEIIFNEKLKRIKGRITTNLLKSLNFPSSLNYIDYAAFYECTNLESITFNSWPNISGDAFYKTNIHKININYNDKQLSIKVDKNYALRNIYKNSNRYMHIEFISDDTILKIKVDKELNKFEKYELFKFSKNQIDNNCFKLNKKYSKINISECNINNLKILDFSDFDNTDINFKLDGIENEIDTVILPKVNNKSLVNIIFQFNTKVQNIIIKDPKINSIENNNFELKIDSPYYINSIKQINGYYVFILYENNYDIKNKHSIILNNKNEVIYSYNTIINNSTDLNIALKNNTLNNTDTKLDYVLKKHNISQEALKEVLEVMLESLSSKKEISKNKDEIKMLTKVNKG